VLIQRRRWWGGTGTALAIFLGLAVVACDSSNEPGPVTVPESRLEFVPLSGTAPPLETRDTSFWAVRGQDRRMEIRFRGDGGPGTGKRFLELEIDTETLLRRPDGTPFADGDSIEIFVRVDTALFLASFEPSGLVFNPEEPAQLEIDYDEADVTFLRREGEFDLWRQERPGEPWVRMGSLRLEDFDEIEAVLDGFTRYALAIGR
jgi:hypothetical protein